MPDEFAPFGIPPAYDPMTGAQIGGDLGRTEPEAYPNKLARAIIQVIGGMPKQALVDAPAALIDSARRAPLPGAERTPENEAAMQDLAGNSFMTALGLAGQAMPFAPSGAAGIFGGRLAKTADHAALRTAEEMHAAGADRGAIWDKTGWFRGEDGKWRFEIPDNEAQMHPSYYTAMPEGKYGQPIAGELWHPEVYQAYPSLRDISMNLEKTQGAGGSYVPPGASRSGYESINVNAPNAGTARSVGLHELQHGIQEREGFAGGGSPAMFNQADDAAVARDALAWRREMDRYPGTMAEKDAAAAAHYADVDAADWIPSKEAREVARYPEDNPQDVLQRVVELYGLDKNISPHSPRDLYRSIPGEIEARNVQTRRDMTPEERRAKPPWETELDRVASSPTLNSMFGSRVGMLEGGAGSRSVQAMAERPPKKLYRGIVEGQQEGGAQGLGTAHLGRGLYSSRDKSFAKMYATNGRLIEVPIEEGWPSNPLVLRGAGGAESLLLDYVFRNTEFKNAREFNKAYPDRADFLRELGYDGVVAGDEVVKFPKRGE